MMMMTEGVETVTASQVTTNSCIGNETKLPLFLFKFLSSYGSYQFVQLANNVIL